MRGSTPWVVVAIIIGIIFLGIFAISAVEGVTSVGEFGDNTNLLTGDVKFEEGTGITIVYSAGDNSLIFTSTVNVTTLTHPSFVADYYTLLQATGDYTIQWQDPTTDRTIHISDPGGADDYFAYTNATQTFLNKTLEDPIINGGLINGTTIESPVGRDSTYTVAANDSTALGRAQADYVCDGTADDVQIQAAIDALPAAGGKVTLLEGTYDITANLTLGADDAMVGVGWSTILLFDDPGITQGVTLDNQSQLMNMKLELAAGCGTGGARPNVVYANGKTQIWLVDLWIVGDKTVADDGSPVRQNGIGFQAVTWSKVVSCLIEDADRYGIYLGSNSNYNTVGACSFQGNTSYGINIEGSDYNAVTRSTAVGSVQGLYLSSSDYNTITGNAFEGNSGGMYVYSSDYNTIAGNIVEGNTQGGIVITTGSDGNTVAGNTSANNDSGGNTYSGIYIFNSNQNVVTGNQASGNGLHGIYIFRSSYTTVTGNVASNQNTGDGINVTGDGTANADYNSITANTCTGNGDDGIEISEVAPGDANETIVIGNQLSGNTGTSFVDGGTDTRISHNIGTYDFNRFTIFTEDTDPGAGFVYVGRDNTGDLTLNALSGKTINLAINGGDEYTFSSAAANWNNNNLDNVEHVGFTDDPSDADRIITATENYLIGDNAGRFGIYLDTRAYKTSAAYSGYLYGIYNEVGISGSNDENWTGSDGVTGITTHTHLTGVAGGNAYTLSKSFGLRLSGLEVGSNVTVTDHYNLYIDNATGGGTLHNQYGVYLTNITAGDTLNYAIYSVGGSVHFGGPDGIDMGTGSDEDIDLVSVLVAGNPVMGWDEVSDRFNFSKSINSENGVRGVVVEASTRFYFATPAAYLRGYGGSAGDNVFEAWAQNGPVLYTEVAAIVSASGSGAGDEHFAIRVGRFTGAFDANSFGVASLSNSSIIDAAWLSTGVSDDDYYILGAVDNDTQELIDVLRVQGASVPYVVIGSGERMIAGAEINFEKADGSSLYIHEYMLPASSLSPGASGADEVAPDGNTLGGWDLDVDTEKLYFWTHIESDWDRLTNMTLEVIFEINDASGAGGNTVDLQAVVRYKGPGESVVRSQTVEVARVVGVANQWTQFHVHLNVWFDIGGGNNIEVEDTLAFTLNLETDTSEIDDITVNYIEFKYRTKKPAPVEIH